MCMIRIGDGGGARHGVEGQRVGVLEENEALDAELLDPLGDNPVLRPFIHSFTRYAVQTQVHVAVAVRLAQEVAVGEDGEVAGGVDDGGNDVLLHEEDLISVHAEVVVFLEELEGTEGEEEEMRGYRAWLESEVMIARGMRWD